MPRGREFSPAETQLILDNHDMTIAELEAVLAKNGYFRSRKSINRKLEKLRENSVIGFRSKDTVKRAYKQRSKKPAGAPAAPSFGSGPSFGEGSWDSGGGWDDNEEA